ncbi:MAG: hypothetical protein ABIR32_16725 [Ilumatobacteraceae bacterium]
MRTLAAQDREAPHGEQQASFETDGETISRLRIMRTGILPH